MVSMPGALDPHIMWRNSCGAQLEILAVLKLPLINFIGCINYVALTALTGQAAIAVYFSKVSVELHDLAMQLKCSPKSIKRSLGAAFG